MFSSFGILGAENQEQTYNYYVRTLLSKLNTLFEFENLPEQVDKDYLNLQLFTNGLCGFFKIKNNIYVGTGGLGGEPNEYYLPTNFILANPVLGSKTFDINGKNANCIVMYNTDADRQMFCYNGLGGLGGLSSLVRQTATLLTDNIMSINACQINSRAQSVFTAENKQQRDSAESYIKKLYAGEPYQIILSDELSPFQVLNIDSGSDKVLQNLIELHQYIIADFYNNIGITTTPYQKKERLITDEIGSIDTMTACTIDSMLKSRQTAVEQINELFGLNISVKKADFLEEKEVEEPEEQEEGEDGENNMAGTEDETDDKTQ